MPLLTNVIEKIMQKNKVGRGTKTIVLSAHKYDKEYLFSFLEAAANLGAKAVHLVAPLP